MCHVAIVAKFLDLNTTVFLQIWYETTKKIDLYDFSPYDCTQEQHSNKMTRQATVGHSAYREHQTMGYFSSGHALKKLSFTLFLKKNSSKTRGGGGGGVRNKHSTVFS